jgi:hypothetical protein
MRYRDLREVPRRPPKAGVLVHNWVHAQWENQRPGRNGFRVWMEPKPRTGRPLCHCGCSGLPHYRTTGLGIAGTPPVVTGKRCRLRCSTRMRGCCASTKPSATRLRPGESAGSDLPARCSSVCMGAVQRTRANLSPLIPMLTTPTVTASAVMLVSIRNRADQSGKRRRPDHELP